jgi:hypothetical protein
METKMKRLFKLSLLALFVLAIVAGCNKDEAVELDVKSSPELELKSGHATQNQILAEIRRATAKYLNYDKAIADGIFLPPNGHCVEHPVLGGMGYHYINPHAGPGVDPSNPQVLLYEPVKNGKKQLVGVEFLIDAEFWDSNNNGPPMLGNVEFDDHREIIWVDDVDELGNPILVPVNAKGGPPFPHYQLHVWVWKNNPNGMYTAFNPNVSCDFSEH